MQEDHQQFVESVQSDETKRNRLSWPLFAFKLNAQSKSIIVFWRPIPATSRTNGVAFVGFVANRPDLRERFHIWETNFGFAHLAPDAAEPDLPSVPLPDPFDPDILQVDRERWNQRLKEARRPIQFAAVLIPTLGLGMLAVTHRPAPHAAPRRLPVAYENRLRLPTSRTSSRLPWRLSDCSAKH
jgi:hypothetical protein